MACAGHCLGAAMATVARMPHFACANSQRCAPGVASAGHLVFSLQHLPVAFGAGNVWKPRAGDAVSRPGSQRMIVMASQEAGTSTLVVQEVEFVWKGPGSKVLVSGDFVNWESQVPLEKTGSDGWFVVKQKLAPGTYKYKYIVDGEWQHSPDFPTVSDNAGGFNNEITVAESKSAPQSASKESNAGSAQAKAVEAKEAAPKPAASSETVPPAEAKEVKPKPSAAASPPKPKVAAAGSETEPPAGAKEAAPKPKPSAAASPPKPKAAAAGSETEPPAEAKEAAPKPKPSAAASPPKPKAAAAGGKKAKAVVKPLLETMVEDVVPQLTAYFQEKEKGISDVDIQFADNQLQGSFIKNQVPYNFWAYFPDGQLEGSRGFSLTSHGSAPSTVEPFLIDENKITADAVVQQVIKRLFAQKLLSTN